MLTDVMEASKLHLQDSELTELVASCLTFVGHLLYECPVNHDRFIQLHGMLMFMLTALSFKLSGIFHLTSTTCL